VAGVVAPGGAVALTDGVDAAVSGAPPEGVASEAAGVAALWAPAI
jgi:hypothetical protein